MEKHIIYRQAFELEEGDEIQLSECKNNRFKFTEDSTVFVVIKRVKTGRFELYNYEGTKVIQEQFDSCTLIKGFIIIYDAGNQKYNIYNTDGVQIGEDSYEDVQIESDIICIKKNGFWGVISREQEQVIIQSNYDSCTQRSQGGTSNSIFVEKDGLKGVFSMEGENIIPVEFDDIFRYYNAHNVNMFVVRKEKKFGVYTCAGKKIVPVEFDQVYTHLEGVEVCKGNLLGLYSRDGRQIISPQEVSITCFTRREAWMIGEKKGSEQRIDLNGEIYLIRKFHNDK